MAVLTRPMATSTTRRTPAMSLTNNNPPATSFIRKRPTECHIKVTKLYSYALELAREEEFDAARLVFEATISACPNWSKPWVSYAQMEKRSAGKECDERWRCCRDVLQRALVVNPKSAQLIQAWGLMELKRGNWLAAIMLLERCALYNVACQPVLRWKVVVEAKQTVSERRKQRQQ